MSLVSYWWGPEDKWKYAEISLCPSGLSSGVTGGALLGGLKEVPVGAVAVGLSNVKKKKDFASAFLPG